MTRSTSRPVLSPDEVKFLEKVREVTNTIVHAHRGRRAAPFEDLGAEVAGNILMSSKFAALAAAPPDLERYCQRVLHNRERDRIRQDRRAPQGLNGCDVTTDRRRPEPVPPSAATDRRDSREALERLITTFADGDDRKAATIILGLVHGLSSRKVAAHTGTKASTALSWQHKFLAQHPDEAKRLGQEMLR